MVSSCKMATCSPQILIIALNHSVIVLGKSVEAGKIARQVGYDMYTQRERNSNTPTGGCSFM